MRVATVEGMKCPYLYNNCWPNHVYGLGTRQIDRTCPRIRALDSRMNQFNRLCWPFNSRVLTAALPHYENINFLHMLTILSASLLNLLCFSHTIRTSLISSATWLWNIRNMLKCRANPTWALQLAGDLPGIPEEEIPQLLGCVVADFEHP